MKTTDERSDKVGWRGTLYSMPSKLVPWWQLPMDKAVDYIYEDAGRHKVKLTIITDNGGYTSLVSASRAINLLAQAHKTANDRQATEILRSVQAIADQY